ncbi:zinc finger, CCHC-type containing protein [Tanacetum coccineum]
MHTRASNSELVESLPEPERTLNRRLRRRNKRVPYDQRNNPPQYPRIVYPPVLNINYFRHFLDILRNYDPMDDEPMWAADHVVAPTPSSAITIPETANEFAIKGSSNSNTDKIMARMDAMTLKMDAKYKELQTHAKKIKHDLDEDNIPMSREEEAKFMQTFRKTRFYNDYRDRDSNRDNLRSNERSSYNNWRSNERSSYNRDNYQSNTNDKPYDLQNHIFIRFMKFSSNSTNDLSWKHSWISKPNLKPFLKIIKLQFKTLKLSSTDLLTSKMVNLLYLFPVTLNQTQKDTTPKPTDHYNLGAYDMLLELKTLFAQQAEHELLQTVREFHAYKKEEGQSVSSYVLKMKSYIDNLEHLGHLVSLNLANYNMHSMGKTVNELHAMLKLHEQMLPKKDVAHALHVIRVGKVQKKKPKKPHKPAPSFAPKPKNPPPPKKNNPAKDAIYHQCCECLRGSRKLKPEALSLNHLVYFSDILRDGIYEIDLSSYDTNDSSMYVVSNKRAKLNLESSLLWHCRLGHINKKRIKKLQHDGLFNSTDIKSFEKCVPCMPGKMARKPYSHQVERAKDLLGPIHINVHLKTLQAQAQESIHFGR